MEQLWRLHDYTKVRKIKLASSEFDGYALLWWHGLVNARREANDLPIRSWREMKEEMQHRFVPRNYRRSLYDKLQNLKQGTLSVDEYYKEMELIMQRAKVREEPEQTLQRFLSGLNFNVKRIVRHYQYVDMEDLLHQAREAELQVAEDAKYLSRSSFGRGSFSSRATPSAVQSSVAPSSRGAATTKPMLAAPTNKPMTQLVASATGSSNSTAAHVI